MKMIQVTYTINHTFWVSDDTSDDDIELMIDEIADDELLQPGVKCDVIEWEEVK